MIHYYFKKFLIPFLLFISACSSIPQNTSNSCKIFDERYLWYKHAKKVEQKWGTPIYIQLAIIKAESDFDWLAKPPRKRLFKIIPFKRFQPAHDIHVALGPEFVLGAREYVIERLCSCIHVFCFHLQNVMGESAYSLSASLDVARLYGYLPRACVQWSCIFGIANLLASTRKIANPLAPRRSFRPLTMWAEIGPTWTSFE